MVDAATGPSIEDGIGDLPAVRQARLAELVRTRGQVSVTEIVGLFGVSRDTVRRDLALLAERDLLVRTHGGAMASDRLVTTVTTLTSRMDSYTAAKERIARAAATMIRDGETLMLNGGSTTTFFARALADRRDLTIVTNNLRVLQSVPEGCLRRVYVLGGTYSASSQATVEFAGFAALPRISVDTALIGVTGIAAGGCSISRLDEAAATAEMMRVCRRTIVLADSSKFGVDAFAHVADHAAVEHLITDEWPTEPLASALATAGVQVNRAA